jgi:hypothetical protein
MLRFHDVLEVDPDGLVIATGPLEPATDEIVDLCAWVFQRGDHDAASTEMTHDHGAHLLIGEGELAVAGDKWTLPLGKIGDEALEPGDAFAVAVALLKENGKQRVVWWGHPVKLTAGGTAGS